MRAAEEPPEGGGPLRRNGPAGIGVTVVAHGAELEDLGLPSRTGDPYLPEQRGPAQLPPRHRREQGDERAERDEQRQRDRDIERPLHEPCGSIRPAQRKQRNAPDLVQDAAGHRRAELRQPGYDGYVGRQLPGLAQRGQQGSVPIGRGGHDDTPDPVLANDRGQVGGSPEHRQRQIRADRPLTRETGEPQAEFGVVAYQAGELGSHRPGADDYYRLGQAAPAAGGPQDLVGGRAAAADHDGGQQGQPDRRPRGQPREQAERGQHRRPGDPARLVGDARGDLQPVLVADRQYRQDHRGVADRRTCSRPA